MLRRIEQQRSPCSLGFHDSDGSLRAPLMSPEIELETVAQDFLVHISDTALPRGTGIRHQDIQPAKGMNDRRKPAFNRCGFRHIALNGNTADFSSHRTGCIPIAVHHSHFGTGTGKCGSGRPADSGAAAGNCNDMTGKRLFHRLAKLCLLQRPVFDLENIFLGNTPVTPQPLCIGDYAGRGLGKIGGNRSVFRRLTEAE